MEKTKLYNLTMLYDAAEKATQLALELQAAGAGHASVDHANRLASHAYDRALYVRNAVAASCGDVVLGRTDIRQMPVYWHGGEAFMLTLDRVGAMVFHDIARAQEYGRSVNYCRPLDVLVEVDEQAYDDKLDRARQAGEEQRQIPGDEHFDEVRWHIARRLSIPPAVVGVAPDAHLEADYEDRVSGGIDDAPEL